MPVDSLRHYKREDLALEVIENQVEVIDYLVNLCIKNKINIKKIVPTMRDTERLFKEMGIISVYKEGEN